MVRSALLALALTLASAAIHPETDEQAMYGFDGPLAQTWLPRTVAGWPAPFIADDPDTSVPHRIGVEDDFRPGPFVATLSFWFLVTRAAAALVRRLRDRGHNRV